MSSRLNQLNFKRWFGFFVILHLFLWTLLPSMVRPTIMHDVAEGIAWGGQWQLGYDKHPPLAAWLCAVFTDLFGTVGWPVYFLAQLAVIVSFWAIWRLALRITTPLYALVSVFALEGIIYYNCAATKFTPDTIQTPIWALMMLLFYITLKERKLWQWIGLGTLAGIALWSKYQVLILFLAMFIVMIVTRQGRLCFKQLGPYVTALVCLVVIMPHLIWAYHYHFPGVTYLLNSTTGNLHHAADDSLLKRHIGFLLLFTLNQIGACAGLIVMYIPFYFGRKNSITLPRFEQVFLFLMALGPFLLSLLYSLITGSALIHRWCIPYFSALSLWLLLVLQPEITWLKFKWFMALFLTIAVGCLLGRYAWLGYIGPYWAANVTADAYYPAKPMALCLTNYWHEHYPDRLRYVSGDHYDTAYVATYSPDHPAPLMGWDKTQSEWINIADFRQVGGMLVWKMNSTQPYQLPEVATKLFPNAKLLPKQSFTKLTHGKQEFVDFGIAVVPPTVNLHTSIVGSRGEAKNRMELRENRCFFR